MIEPPFAGGRVDELVTMRDQSGFEIKVLAWRVAGTVRFRLGVRPPESAEAVWTDWTSWRKGESSPVERPGL